MPTPNNTPKPHPTHISLEFLNLSNTLLETTPTVGNHRHRYHHCRKLSSSLETDIASPELVGSCSGGRSTTN